MGLQDTQVPSTAPGILAFNFYPETGRHAPQKIMGNFLVELMKPRMLTTREQQVLYNILKALSQIVTFTLAAEKMLEVRFILLGVLGLWPMAKRPYEFPERFQEIAAALLAKVDEDIPIMEVVSDDDDAETAAPASSSSSSFLFLPSSSSSSSKEKKDKKKKRAREPAATAAALPNLILPALQPTMHNLTLTTGAGGRRTYRITNKTAARPCNVVGHNGLTVGQWWPYRICALRDGAHGATQSGIAGSAKSGAYSVVVSGKSPLNTT